MPVNPLPYWWSLWHETRTLWWTVWDDGINWKTFQFKTMEMSENVKKQTRAKRNDGQLKKLSIVIPQSFSIYIQCPVPCVAVLHYRLGIGIRSKFGYPFFDIVQLFVKPIRLNSWIKNPEIRCRIATWTRCPLPISIVGGQIIVIQLLRKISFTPTPIDQ